MISTLERRVCWLATLTRAGPPTRYRSLVSRLSVECSTFELQEGCFLKDAPAIWLPIPLVITADYRFWVAYFRSKYCAQAHGSDAPIKKQPLSLQRCTAFLRSFATLVSLLRLAAGPRCTFEETTEVASTRFQRFQTTYSYINTGQINCQQ